MNEICRFCKHLVDENTGDYCPEVVGIDIANCCCQCYEMVNFGELLGNNVADKFIKLCEKINKNPEFMEKFLSRDYGGI